MVYNNLSADSKSLHTAAAIIEFGVKVQYHNTNKLPISRCAKYFSHENVACCCFGGALILIRTVGKVTTRT